MCTAKPCLSDLSAALFVGNIINPVTFFTHKNGLWLQDDFVDLALVYAKDEVLKIESGQIWYADITRDSADVEVMKCLHSGFGFNDVDQLLSILAILIGSQWSGNDGPLRTDGHGNIFYFTTKHNESFYIDVYWMKSDHEWNLDAGLVSDITWASEARFFSRVP